MSKLLIKFGLVVIFILGYNAQVFATPVDTFEFSTPEKQKHALVLARELRCPQCQNQDLVDSNSPIARDLRHKVYEMVENGQSDDDIIQFMTSRYGEFVLYKPKLEGKTYILWLGPIAFIILGGLISFVFVRRQKSNNVADDLSAEDKEQLADLLKRKNND